MKPGLPILLAGTVLTAAVHAQSVTLFRDDFTRANNTDLNASTAGQSGSLSPLSWVENNVNGNASINGNQLRLDATASSGNDGSLVYPDWNFTGLTGLTVTMDIDSGGSGGNGRATGFGIGYTKAALDGKTSVSLGNLASGSDVFIAYDTIGSSKSLTVRNNNSQVFSKAIPSPAYPVEYKIVFTFTDMNDGTAITYEVFENGGSIYNGATTWTGTDQNYVGIGSNYTANTDINFVQIEGVLPPPPSIVKDDNTDDLNLGTSWVGGTAPASGEAATWDSTVTGANTTVLGADATWGTILIEDPAGLVTIGAGNTLTLDSLGTLVDMSGASADLIIDANLAMTGSGVWDVATGRTLSVSGVVSGASGVTKAGDGTAVISGNNTYTNGTNVNAGVLQLGASNVIPDTTDSGDVSVTGTLDLNGNSDTIWALTGSGTVDNTADSTTSTLTVGDFGKSGTFSGTLQNSGTSAIVNLEKIGSGNLVLSGASTYSGTTTVSGGSLEVGSLGALGNTSGVSLADGTEFNPDVDGLIVTAPITLDTVGTTSFIGVPINGGTMTLNGVISGGGDLVFTDFDTFGSNTSGIIVLGAASTYTGTTTIATGAIMGNNTIVKSGITNALPTTTVLSLEGLAGQGSGRFVTFDLDGNDQTLAGLQNVPQFDRKQRVTSTGAATLTVNNTDDFSFGVGGGGDGYAQIQGAISLAKSGAGTLTLSEAQPYTGTTSVNQGTLGLDGTSLTSDVTVAGGASLEFRLGVTASTSGTLDLGTGTVKIDGVVDGSSDYQLMTATGGVTGTLTLDSAITDYALELRNGDTELWLALVPAGFASWAATNGAAGGFDDDHDGDGVANGIEFFIGGPNGNTTGFTPLPSVVDNAGTLSVTWTKAADYPGVYGTDYWVETSATLAAPWTMQDADPTPGFTVTFPSPTEVKFTFPAGTKDFARLSVTGP